MPIKRHPRKLRGMPSATNGRREPKYIKHWIPAKYAWKVQELTGEVKRFRWDILGFVEVSWTDFGETTTDEGYKIWYCGEDSKHQFGVAVIVRKEAVGSSISCTPSPRGYSVPVSISVVMALSMVRGGDVAVYVYDMNQPSLPTPSFFILFLCLFLSLWPFQLYFIP